MPCFVAFPTAAKLVRLVALLSRNQLVHARILNTQARRGSAAARGEFAATEATERLLDSSPRADHVAANGRAPWELMGRLWPILDGCTGRALSLVSLTLTAPRAVDVRAQVTALARTMVWEASDGGVMALDYRRKEHPHAHGIVLMADVSNLVAAWRRETGASCCTRPPITGWDQHVAGETSGPLFVNVARVINYAFKPWPAEFGFRKPHADVTAFGVFAPVWASVLPRLYSTRDANSLLVDARTCPRCGRGMSGMRSDARWCSKQCRNNASRTAIKASRTAIKASRAAGGAG